MRKYKIAVIPGDGIGIDVINEGLKILETAKELHGGFDFEYTHLPWGCEYYKKTGRMMPEDGLKILKTTRLYILVLSGSPVYRIMCHCGDCFCL